MSSHLNELHQSPEKGRTGLSEMRRWVGSFALIIKSVKVAGADVLSCAFQHPPLSCFMGTISSEGDTIFNATSFNKGPDKFISVFEIISTDDHFYL
jgi:hypothetical protein